MLRKIIAVFALVSFVSSSVMPLPLAHAQTLLALPEPGKMVPLSEAYQPALIKGITVHPDNPLLFDFIVDPGQSGFKGDALKAEGAKLVKYFLATLTVPEQDLWVNLSPYEKDRMIPEGFGKTEMGRDILAQDYVLKQLTSTLIYPETDLGKKFWDSVYEKTRAQYNTTDIPIDTFNKIWIVPSEAVVYTNDNSAFVVESHLKVMLEQDFVAMNKSRGIESYGLDSASAAAAQQYSATTTEILRTILIPEIEKEVNTGKNFAALRQVYQAVILAAWFKKNLQESLLGQVYMDKNKVAGIDTRDPQVREKIYGRYLEAFKKGVFNYIKEDVDQATQEAMPRKYFSGGTVLTVTPKVTSDFASLSDGQQGNLDITEGAVNMQVGLFSSQQSALSSDDLSTTAAAGFPKANLESYPDSWYKGKVIAVRADFNIAGTDYTRIKAGMATIKYITERGGRVVVTSHLGQPKNGFEEKFSLKPIAAKLGEFMGQEVMFNGKSTMAEAKNDIANMKDGDVILLENTRFNKGEEALVNAKKALKTAEKSKDKQAIKDAQAGLKAAQKLNDEFAAALYQGADMFVLDGFSVAHRAHVSVVGASKAIPRVAGLLVEEEIAGLSTVVSKVDAVFMGGSKVTTKLPIINFLLKKQTVKTVAIGGAMANAFFAAMGIPMDPRNKGIEADDVKAAAALLKDKKAMEKLVLPVDVVVADSFEPGTETQIVKVDEIKPGKVVLGIGPLTNMLFNAKLGQSEYAFWNGPMGYFEAEMDANGTKTFAQNYAAHKGYTAAGGGDTVAAINKYGIEGIKYVSKSGGASEEYLAGKFLPGVEQLSEPPSAAVYEKQYQGIVSAILQVFPNAFILPNVSTKKVDTSIPGKDPNTDRLARLDMVVGENGERIVEVPQATDRDLVEQPGLAKDWMDFPIIISKENIPADLTDALAKAKTPKETSKALAQYLTQKLTGVIDVQLEAVATDVQGTVQKTALLVNDVIAVKTGTGNLMLRLPFWFMRNDEAIDKVNKALGVVLNAKKAMWEATVQQEEAYAKANWFKEAQELTHNSQEALTAISNYGFRFYDEFQAGNFQRAGLLAQLLSLIDVNEFVNPEKFGIVFDKSIGKLVSTLDKDSKVPYFGDNLKSFMASITYVGSLARFLNSTLMPEYDAQKGVGRVIASPEAVNAALGFYHRMHNHLMMLGFNVSPALAKMLEPERMTLGMFADRLNKAVQAKDAMDVNGASADQIKDFLQAKGVALSAEDYQRLSAMVGTSADRVWAYDVLQLAEVFSQDTFVQAMPYLKVAAKKELKPSQKLKQVFFGGAGRITSMTFLQRIVADYNAKEPGYSGQHMVQSRALTGKTDAERFQAAADIIKQMIMDEGVANSGLNIDGKLVGDMLASGDMKLVPHEKKIAAMMDMVVDIPVEAIYPVDIVVNGSVLGTVNYVNNEEFKAAMATEENKALALAKLQAVGINSFDNIPYPLVAVIDGEKVLFSAISDGTPGGVYIGNGVLEELLDAKMKEQEKAKGKADKLYDGPTMWQLYGVSKYDDGTGDNIGGAPEELARMREVIRQFNLRLAGKPGVIDSEQIYKKLVMPLGGGWHVFGRNIDKLAMVNEEGATVLTPTSCSTNGASYFLQALLAFLGLGMQEVSLVGPTLHDDTSGAKKKAFGRMSNKSTGAADGVNQHLLVNAMFTAVRTPVVLENGKVKVVGGSLYDFIMELPTAVSSELLMKWINRTAAEFPDVLTVFGQKDQVEGRYTWKNHISGQQTGSILLGPVELLWGKFFRVTDAYDNEMSFSKQDALMQDTLMRALVRQQDTATRMQALNALGLALPGAQATKAKIDVVADLAFMQGQGTMEGPTVADVVKDAAANATDLGGIDLNPALMDLQVKSKDGKMLTIKAQPISDIQVNGFTPVIINVTPVNSPQFLMGLVGEEVTEEEPMLLSKL